MKVLSICCDENDACFLFCRVMSENIAGSIFHQASQFAVKGLELTVYDRNMYVLYVLVDDRVHTAFWCQRQNQGSSLTRHIYVQAAKARHEHHLISDKIQRH